MEKDCEIYVDPEEDEVFFGCMSEKEKTLFAQLANHEESDMKENSINKTAEEVKLNVDEENNKNILMNEQSGVVQKQIIIDDPIISESTNQHDNSVEMEHNYSTPVKPKIDKSILSTPKSIVKADKDGGFLKVLSEIALVKAEAEGDNEVNKMEDEEDKENKIKQQIPDIRVTEATPERIVLSPPNNNINTKRRQFRIIYRSPREDKFDQKSHSDSEKDIKKGVQVLNNKRKSIDLIDLDDLDNLNDSIKESDKEFEKVLDCVVINDTKPENGVKITTVCESSKEVQITVPDVKSPPKIETPKPPKGLRFSKEARKIVEVLKKSALDDTLNFTIPEIDVENEENSFISPECLYFGKGGMFTEEMEKTIPQRKFLCKTVEKERLAPTTPQVKPQPVQHFSERRIYQIGRSGVKNCVKKLPLEEKKPFEKAKEATTSNIPVFRVRNVKTPSGDKIPRAAPTKTSKTPITTIPKNPKFNHIESPINAYIHSKQTALVVNVKPEQRKHPSGIARLQTTVRKPTQTKSETRSTPIPEKSKKPHSASAMRLPFVEYKSATPYKIEKATESRLPRLAPSVQKLIGTHSPRVLRHEGRFYLTSPRKASSTENTIVADPNEVSVVVCQSAQKSNTIK